MDFQSENLMRKYLGLPPLAGGEEVSASFDGADAACTCACDAAPKKQQTLEQHLKQYHHGQMPKGDCSWLKQYKKDHPDWQKDAAKVSKGEAAVDTAKKDAAPNGKDKLKGSSKDVLKRFGVNVLKKRFGVKEEDIPSDFGEQVKMVDKLTKFDEYKKGAEERDKKRIATAQKQFPSPKLVTRQAAGFNDDGTYNHEKDVYGFGNGKDYVEFTGKELDDLAKKDDKKSSASEYLDAVKKDKGAKKSSVGKKENLDDKGRYIPTQEEIDAACQAMSDSFDFSKEGVAKMVKDLIAGNRVWQGKDGGLLDIVQAMKGKGGVVRAIKERAKEQFIRDDHPWFKEDFWKGK